MGKEPEMMLTNSHTNLLIFIIIKVYDKGAGPAISTFFCTFRVVPFIAGQSYIAIDELDHRKISSLV